MKRKKNLQRILVKMAFKTVTRSIILSICERRSKRRGRGNWARENSLPFPLNTAAVRRLLPCMLNDLFVWGETTGR